MRQWFGKLSPGARSAALSFVLPGLGQMYIGLIGRAFIWFVGLVVIASVMRQQTGPAWAGLVLSLALSVFAALDAYLMSPRTGPTHGG